MKFFELIALFKIMTEEVKKNNVNNPSLKYIIIAYNNVIKNISDSYSENEMVTDKKINKLELTSHMKEKLIYLSNQNITKKLKASMEEERHNINLKKDLNALLGIGDKKAEELISKGLKNVRQLMLKKWFNELNTDTQFVLVHRPLRQINYADIKKIENKLTDFGKNVVLVGSFRRQKPIIRDIDILFLENSAQKIDKYLEYLKKTFNIWIYLQGTDKISFIFQPDSTSDIKYKADIFLANKENFNTMLLYTTGSRFHNIKMRARAKYLGYLLNQNGIYNKDGKKINKSDDNEVALFKILNMDYVIPEKRF